MLRQARKEQVDRERKPDRDIRPLCFSGSYGLARGRFRKFARRRRARMYAFPISALGPRQEKLTIDIAWLGADKPRSALIHICGVHGADGYDGSAIQIQKLRARPVIPKDAAIVFVHALDPFGMAWQRRSNENGVDLEQDLMEGPAGRPLQDGPAQFRQFLEQTFSGAERIVIVDAQTVAGEIDQGDPELLGATTLDFAELKTHFGNAEQLKSSHLEFFRVSENAEIFYLRQLFDPSDFYERQLQVLEFGRSVLVRAENLAFQWMG
jgi:hypothetical protein